MSRLIWAYLGEQFTPGWKEPTKLQTVIGMLQCLGYLVLIGLLIAVTVFLLH